MIMIIMVGAKTYPASEFVFNVTWSYPFIVVLFIYTHDFWAWGHK